MQHLYKTALLAGAVFIGGALKTQAQVGIGTAAPDSKAVLDLQSPTTNQGLLVPRLTAAQRTAITAPPKGLLVFQTDETSGFYYATGTGTNWLLLPDATTNAGSFIQNQTATDQAASFRISGTGQLTALTGSSTSVGTGVKGLGVTSYGGLNLGENTTGNSLFIGYQAGPATTAGPNHFVGYQAGKANTGGNQNYFSGYHAGLVNTGGSNNHFSGFETGLANVGGNNNVAVGFQSGHNNVSGNNNVSIGWQAGNGNTADNNMFVGYTAGYNSTTGIQNTFMGWESGFGNGGGSANTFSGFQSGRNSTGANNVFSGFQAGFDNGTGLNNSAFGFQAGPTGAGLQNATAIGFQAKVSQSNSLVLGGTGGIAVSVGIGTTAPAATLHVAGAGSTIRFEGLGGGGSRGLVVDNAGNVTAATGGSSGDNLGNGVATSDVSLAGFKLTGTGTSITGVGLGVTARGGINIGQNTAGNNVFIGYQTGAADNSFSVSNTFVGYQAGLSNVQGSRNSFSGHQSGYSELNGTDNYFAGYRSGYNNFNGSSNTYVGTEAGRGGAVGAAGATGNNNANNVVALGYQAGLVNTASNNHFEGYQAGLATATGSNNTFIGYTAGSVNTSGSNNLALGYQAGPTTGSTNLAKSGAIGYNAKVSASNSLVLGGTGTDAVNVGIGTTAPTSTLQVTGSVAANIRTLATGTVADTDYTVLVTGNINLPAPATGNTGRIYNLLNGSNGSPVVTATFRDAGSTGTITSFTFGTSAGGKGIVVQSDGTQWWIIARN